MCDNMIEQIIQLNRWMQRGHKTNNRIKKKKQTKKKNNK